MANVNYNCSYITVINEVRCRCCCLGRKAISVEYVGYVVYVEYVGNVHKLTQIFHHSPVQSFPLCCCN